MGYTMADSQGRRQRKRLIIFLLVLIILALAAGVVIPKPRIPRARVTVVESGCRSNVIHLVKAELMYSMDHNRKFSEKLSDLYAGYVAQLYQFKCPLAGGPDITTREEIDSLTSYVLRRGLTEDPPGGEVLIYEKAPCADRPASWGRGGNAVTVDGHWKWLSALELRKIIEEDQGKQG